MKTTRKSGRMYVKDVKREFDLLYPLFYVSQYAITLTIRMSFRNDTDNNSKPRLLPININLFQLISVEFFAYVLQCHSIYTYNNSVEEKSNQCSMLTRREQTNGHNSKKRWSQTLCACKSKWKHCFLVTACSYWRHTCIKINQQSIFIRYCSIDRSNVFFLLYFFCCCIVRFVLQSYCGIDWVYILVYCMCVRVCICAGSRVIIL